MVTEFKLIPLTFPTILSFLLVKSRGQNAGAFLSFSKNNDSGIGLSVLNIGNTKTKKIKNKLRGEFSKVGEVAEEQASKLGLNIAETTEIKEQVNVGLNFSTNRKSYLFAHIAADYHDIFDKSLENKLSASTEMGISNPKRPFSSFKYSNKN